MAERNYGRTASGALITDDLVDELAAKFEASYDIDERLRGSVTFKVSDDEMTESLPERWDVSNRATHQTMGTS